MLFKGSVDVIEAIAMNSIGKLDYLKVFRLKILGNYAQYILSSDHVFF
jgi:hypothetical protein